MSISPTFALGFHSQNQFDAAYRTGNRGESKAKAMAFNIMNIVGYFPLVGTITGIIKLHLLCSNDVYSFQKDSGESLCKAFFARWIVETLSLGALLLIPDLIVSISRAYKSEVFTLA